MSDDDVGVDQVIISSQYDEKDVSINLCSTQPVDV